MTIEQAITELKEIKNDMVPNSCQDKALDIAIVALKQQSIDESAMIYEIYMEGVNMTGEYQGCWVRFKDIKRIVDKYMTESENTE